MTTSLQSSAERFDDVCDVLDDASTYLLLTSDYQPTPIDRIDILVNGQPVDRAALDEKTNSLVEQHLAFIDRGAERMNNEHSQEKGLKVHRAAELIRQIGSAAVVKYLDSHEYFKMLSGIGCTTEPGILGQYIGPYRTALVRRDPILELFNGSGLTLSVAVHEAVHGMTLFHRQQIAVNNRHYPTNPAEQTRMHMPSYPAVRMQFLTGYDALSPNTGVSINTLMDAYAELWRGKFIVQQLGLRHGFAGDSFRDCLPDSPPGIDIYSYFIDKGNGAVLDKQPMVTQSALPALMLEAMIFHTPELAKAIGASFWSKDALPEVKGRMDTIAPWLFNAIMQMPPKETFKNMLGLYKGVIGCTEPGGNWAGASLATA